MKYLISLLLGVVVGAALFAVGVLYNPFINTQNVSPLSVTDARTLTLGFSDVAADNILFTNDGLSRRDPSPQDVLQLWERPIRQTQMFATVLHDVRSQPTGIGIKVSSLSERTRVLNGEALIDSVWYIYLPGRGGLFIEQTENHWEFARDVVVPAYRSSAKLWKGSWLGNLTAGPGALRTANVNGGSGEFAGVSTIGLESLAVKAWSVEHGAVSAEGRLIIELPDLDEEQADSES